MSLGTARLLVAEIEAESTARPAALEAALGEVLAEFTAEAEHVEGSGWYVVWVPRKRLKAWRDILADQTTAPASTAEAKDRIEYTIIVDTVEHTVEHARVTWEEVVEFAYPGQSGHPQYVFKVQYEDAASHPSSGALVKGGHVEVERQGTTFSVLRSVVS